MAIVALVALALVQMMIDEIFLFSRVERRILYSTRHIRSILFSLSSRDNSELFALFPVLMTMLTSLITEDDSARMRQCYI